MNDSEVPIDIHISKLQDWLISRRHCSRKWQPSVVKIREKINSAIQDMPENEEIVKLLAGSYINYFHCLKIVEVLKHTEKDTRNIFGRYGSQRMRDWQEIIGLYEKDSIYLAEVAQVLSRNIVYEIPSLKRQISKCEQQIQEFEKKQANYNRNSTQFQQKFSSSCKQLGIEGSNIRKELISLLSELPDIFDREAAELASTQRAKDFYETFVNFVSSKDACSHFPLLNLLIGKGNVTVYEWMHGQAPSVIEKPAIDLVELRVDDNSEPAATQEEEEEGTIDFGDDEVDPDSGGIDWGNLDPGDSVTIDFSVDTATVTPCEGGSEEGVAKDVQALTLLDNAKTREQILNNLVQIEAFLEQRLADLSEQNDDSDILTLSQFQSAPGCIQLVGKQEVREMLASVRHVISVLASQRTRHLHQIKMNPRYIDRLCLSLNQHLISSKKMDSLANLMKEKSEETLAKIGPLRQLLQTLSKGVKELQGQVEKEISKKYNNRPVFLMGGL